MPLLGGVSVWNHHNREPGRTSMYNIGGTMNIPELPVSISLDEVDVRSANCRKASNL